MVLLDIVKTYNKIKLYRQFYTKYGVVFC